MGSRRIASSDMEGCTSGISHKVTTALCEETSQTEQTKGLVSGRQILRQAGRQADKQQQTGNRSSTQMHVLDIDAQTDIQPQVGSQPVAEARPRSLRVIIPTTYPLGSTTARCRSPRDWKMWWTLAATVRRLLHHSMLSTHD